MSKTTSAVIVSLLTILVVLVARPQYLEWRAERDAREAQSARMAAKVAAAAECRSIAREFEGWRTGSPLPNSATSSEKDAESRVWNCILADHIKTGDVAHLSRL